MNWLEWLALWGTAGFVLAAALFSGLWIGLIIWDRWGR